MRVTPSLMLLLVACAGRGAPRGETPTASWGVECPGDPVEAYSTKASHCVRPDPKPAFTAKDGTDHRLSRCEQDTGPDVTMRSMVEEITLDDGTQVVLNNSGCGYLTINLTFMLPGDETPVNDASAWRLKSAQLLRQVLEVGDLPMEANYTVAADQLEAAKGLGFREELELQPASAIPTTLMMESAASLPGDGGRSLILRLSTGPL
ncbi:MAG: hypothetical protein H6741_16005 [Alphaproteobacteria bacterium]|nr:hypothetical protein [Alphaproteobacteria bacterium]